MMALSSGIDWVRAQWAGSLSPRAPIGIMLAARTARNFSRHEMSTYAAALAYRSLLAFFPFAIFLIALTNALDAWRLFDMLAHWARTEPQGRVPAAIKEWLVNQAREGASGAVVSMGAVVAVWAVASGARVLRRALNAAGDVPEVHPAWKRLLISLAAAPVLAAAVLMVVVFWTVTRRFVWRLAGWFHVNESIVLLWDWARFPLGLGMAGLLLCGVYVFASSRRHPVRSVLPGTVTATLIWAGASILLPAAVSSGLRFGVTYGSFTAAIALLGYFYVASAGLLLGAELNASVAAGRTGADDS